MLGSIELEANGVDVAPGAFMARLESSALADVLIASSGDATATTSVSTYFTSDRFDVPLSGRSNSVDAVVRGLAVRSTKHLEKWRGKTTKA